MDIVKVRRARCGHREGEENIGKVRRASCGHREGEEG